MGATIKRWPNAGKDTRLPLMNLDAVSMRFGDFTALNELSFAMEEGEVLGVAGPNGAGKTTLMNVCTGGLRASAGRVLLKGKDVTGLRRHARCAAGISQTFQIPKLIESITVGENLLAGHVFGSPDRKSQSNIDLDQVIQLVGLSDEISMPAHQADLLTRKRIMLGAALATGPKLLFLDEPLGGLNGREIEQLLDVIRAARAQLSITVVMVEHKTRALADIADRILILNFGELVMLDTPGVVLNDDHVVEIYLGKKHDA